MPENSSCRYQFDSGEYCQEIPEKSSEYCYFHDSSLPKNTEEAKNRLLRAVADKKDLQGAYLKDIDLSHSDLSGAKLVKCHLDRAKLIRANLEGAHLYGASLKEADLFNSNLKHANLKETNLEGANILEIKIEEAKILGIHWGKECVVQNELDGRKLEKSGRHEQANEKFREAEEIYRNVRVHLMKQGIFDEAADFFYREMVVRRKQLPLFSVRRLSSKIIDLLCGYGEKTFRVILCAALFVFINSFLFLYSAFSMMRI